jgi:MFS family permease
MNRTKFPRVFWVGNGIEVLERFAYYGLYIGFAIFAKTAIEAGGLGWSMNRLGVLQSVFLALSYSIPLIAGPLADRYGFKLMLMISYVLYLPGFLGLLATRQDYVVFAVMSLIAVAAGVFKPLIAGTVRLTTDETNQTLGFGIFYLMVNVGAFFGPMTAGALRTIHWNYSFLASAVAVVAMIVVTALFYKNPIEPKKDEKGVFDLILEMIREILRWLFKPRMLVFIIIFGVFIEIPFWAFFNLCAVFVDTYVRTDILYNAFTTVLPVWFVNLFDTVDENGVHRIAGETLAHTALYIILFQMLVTRTTERMRSVPVVALGVFVMTLGCVGLYYSTGEYPGLMFLGILLFAVGEMACMPRFEQYLITLLPKEKTGLGGGLLRIPVVVGAASGVLLTPLYGKFEIAGTPQSIWLVMAAMLIAGVVLLFIYDRVLEAKGV